MQATAERTARRQAQRIEALGRARDNTSFANYPAIIEGFSARGIPAADILPRENVFTYNAWQALGRQVQRGEHGVKVTTFIKREGVIRPDGQREPDTSYCTSATVFHVSQTQPIAG